MDNVQKKLCTVIVYRLYLSPLFVSQLEFLILIIHEHYISTPFTNCNVPHS